LLGIDLHECLSSNPSFWNIGASNQRRSNERNQKQDLAQPSPRKGESRAVALLPPMQTEFQRTDCKSITAKARHDVYTLVIHANDRKANLFADAWNDGSLERRANEMHFLSRRGALEPS